MKYNMLTILEPVMSKMTLVAKEDVFLEELVFRFDCAMLKV
jgi:hypothetical protein